MNYNIFFLFSLLSWICYIIELPPSSIIILWQLYFFTKYLKNHYDELDELDLLTNNDDINNHNNIINYEDKYLQEIRKFNKNWVFSDDDLFNEKQLTNTLFDNRKKYLNDRLQFLEVHINNYVKQIEDIKKKIDTQKNNKLLNYDNELDNGLVDEFDDKLDDELYYELENNLDCEFKCEFNNELHYKLVDELNYELNEIYNKYNECNNEYNILKQLINDDIKILEEVENIAHSDIIKNKIQRLENCYVIEKTPLGNVLMIYDINKNSFKYYSDYNIPYRYLEVVARKYVKIFNCIPLYIDMEYEVKLADEKYEKIKNLYQDKSDKQKQLNYKEKDIKEEVFVKFKNYNKSASITSSIPNKKENYIEKNINENSKGFEKVDAKEKQNINTLSIKQKANRYTYQGKFANFDFIKKLDKIIFNKKLGLSFSDFKNLNKRPILY